MCIEYITRQRKGQELFHIAGIMTLRLLSMGAKFFYVVDSEIILWLLNYAWTVIIYLSKKFEWYHKNLYSFIEITIYGIFTIIILIKQIVTIWDIWYCDKFHCREWKRTGEILTCTILFEQQKETNSSRNIPPISVLLLILFRSWLIGWLNK